MEAYWVTTQRLLQHGSDAIVKRPKLTETLLKRPPFRFLHDVVSEVTRRTGFAEGLFGAEELVVSELKDKDAKLRYLTKIISCVGLALESYVPVRPTKILAGLEPQQTNIFLQMLAQAATGDKTSSARAVYRCLAGDHMPSPTSSNVEQSPSGLPSHESSSHQSVSSEKLRRSMYSPPPEPLADRCKSSNVSSPSHQEPHKVDVTFCTGTAHEQEDTIVENLGSCTLSEAPHVQSPLHDEELGTSLPTDPEGTTSEENPAEALAVPNKSQMDAKREELQRLRESIQSLCQAISPLGKCIDYLQEDAEAMAKEYQYWIKEQQTYLAELERERLLTEDIVEAQSQRILELDEEIKNQEELNRAAKAEILKNDETTIALLHTASTVRSPSNFEDSSL